ncbi:MAG: bifunctional 2-polyprenyl-6-hydroxyphenol methylase/3-demethylubiquinol 3-O-methyltransferase UbiG [Rhodospirillales bacterium]
MKTDSTAAIGPGTTSGTASGEEIDRFARIAQAWWDPNGAFRPLHGLNPLRAAYVRDQLCRHFGRDIGAEAPLAGLRIIDIGCGGGLLSEALARMGASVVGIDAESESVGIATAHAAAEGLTIDYRVALPEDLAKDLAAASGERFDAVVSMEVIEHVADVSAFAAAARTLVRPEGALIVATLNRTLKSLALAKIGAEYVLRWLPIGTHDWRKFVKPSELAALFRRNRLALRDLAGFEYDVLNGTWTLSRDLAVNYVAFAVPE